MRQRSGVCLFGGAFDPPHATHRRLAATVPGLLGVAELRVIPAGDHPWRPGLAAGPEHRLAMCRLAFDGLDRVVVDDRELRRPGPSFSIDTVRSVRAELDAASGSDAPLFWLIGSDNLPQVARWHDHHALLAAATVVTFPRAGHPVDAAVLDGLDLTATEKRSLLDHRLDVDADDVNATALRAALARGERPVELLSTVADYIEEHGLYR